MSPRSPWNSPLRMSSPSFNLLSPFSAHQQIKLLCWLCYYCCWLLLTAKTDSPTNQAQKTTEKHITEPVGGYGEKEEEKQVDWVGWKAGGQKTVRFVRISPLNIKRPESSTHQLCEWECCPWHQELFGLVLVNWIVLAWSKRIKAGMGIKSIKIDLINQQRNSRREFSIRFWSCPPTNRFVYLLVGE